MPIVIASDAANGLVRLTVSGTADRYAFADAMVRLQADSALRFQPRLLWDLTDARLVLTSADLADLITLLAPRQQEAGARSAVVAVVAPGDHAFGMGRMSEAMWNSGDNPGTYLVFRTMAEAQGWIDSVRE
jgi:hypothetical protein